METPSCGPGSAWHGLVSSRNSSYRAPETTSFPIFSATPPCSERKTLLGIARVAALPFTSWKPCRSHSWVRALGGPLLLFALMVIHRALDQCSGG